MTAANYINHSSHGPQNDEQRAKNLQCLKAARLAYRVRIGKMTEQDVLQRIKTSDRTKDEKESAVALFQYYLKYDRRVELYNRDCKNHNVDLPDDE